ncbi:extracellular solute-binding protein [Brucella intermedia]|uniref:extracellular solute-binding protein n=1 Tax=Brucella intermedia TaxID=94625 RepID=UPI0022489EBA|nr:extracellular solute-binding protein [Brucella intermedia]
MHRRSFIALAATSILAAPSILRAQDRKFEGITLQVNGYGGDYDRLMTELISVPLERRTGLKVSYTPGASAAAVAKVIATPNSPPFDILLCDSPSLPELVAAQSIQPISASEVAGVGKLIPGIREFGDFGLPISLAASTLTYNTDLVKEPLAALSDLARPDLAGGVGLFNLENNGGLLLLIALAVANGGSLDNMDPGFEAFGKIYPNVVSLTPSTVNLQQLFQQGEAVAGAFWDGRLHSMRAAGVPMAMVSPTEGLYAGRTYFCPVKNSRHPEAVLAFLDQAMSDEFIGGMAKFFRYGPTTNVKLDEDVAASILTHGDGLKKLKPVDWTKVAANRSAWFTRFNREFR